MAEQGSAGQTEEQEKNKQAIEGGQVPWDEYRDIPSLRRDRGQESQGPTEPNARSCTQVVSTPTIRTKSMGTALQKKTQRVLVDSKSDMILPLCSV